MITVTVRATNPELPGVLGSLMEKLPEIITKYRGKSGNAGWTYGCVAVRNGTTLIVVPDPTDIAQLRDSCQECLPAFGVWVE